MERRGSESEQSMFSVEDIPLQQAKMMGRAPRMDEKVYDALQNLIKGLETSENMAKKINLPADTSYVTMKTRLLRVAADMRVELTVRKIRNGLVVWKSSPEEIQEKKAVGERLQEGRQAMMKGGGRKR